MSRKLDDPLHPVLLITPTLPATSDFTSQMVTNRPTWGHLFISSPQAPKYGIVSIQTNPNVLPLLALINLNFLHTGGLETGRRASRERGIASHPSACSGLSRYLWQEPWTPQESSVSQTAAVQLLRQSFLYQLWPALLFA